ncbi:MAG: hypothetical protein KAS12_04340, partial [Candidatus Aenigmarchaeota archaeon]|nr:hypothetical protein [Candidatus Aenigmarchaeota archaeon]
MKKTKQQKQSVNQLKSTSQLEKILFWSILVVTILILFTPLIISQRTFYPFIFGKVIVGRILIEIIFAVYLLLALTFPKYRPNWKNPLLIVSTIFLGVYLLASLFGADLQRSFWSTQERMAGFYSMFHYWLF